LELPPVHAQPGCVVTITEPELAVDGTFVIVGSIEYEHAADDTAAAAARASNGERALTNETASAAHATTLN